MNDKFMIISKTKSNLLNSILYLMEQEKWEYIISESVDNISEDVSTVIYIDKKFDITNAKLAQLNIPVLVICDEKNVLKNTSSVINYIVTNLVNDDTNYTDVQREYLFKKGLYAILNSKVYNFLTGLDNINGLVIDITECEVAPNDWIFKFSSIAETYNWISRKNKSGNKDFIKKGINFYNEGKVYNDSSKEINYLIEKVIDIKNGMNLIDVFVCTREELEKLKNNFLFKSLIKNLSSTYTMFFIDKDELSSCEPELLTKFLDGIIIYEDCVYRDTYNDEYSLGYVDCNSDIINEYNKYFDYILEKYSIKINTDGDINGI